MSRSTQEMISAVKPHLYTECDMTGAAVHPFAGGVALIYSVRSPYKEAANEDAAALIPFDEHSGLLVVADGAGGLRAGAQASGIAIESLQAAVEHAFKCGSSLRESVLSGIDTANHKIAALGIGAATTLVVAEVEGNQIRPYHIGDSMVLIVGQKGKLKLQTVSHSPVGYAVEAGLIDENEAIHHEERHLVSNMLGLPDTRVEVGSKTRLALRDTLLLATDGLFDNLLIDEIRDIVRKGPLEKIGEELAVACHERMQRPAEAHPSKPDDLTYILFRRAR